MLKWTMCGSIFVTGAMLSGCGYTDLEMAAKQREINALVTQVNALKAASACGVAANHTSPAAQRSILSSR